MLEIEEEMIRAKNAYKKESYGTLEEGYRMNGTLVTFEKVEIFNGTICIMLPDTFTDLPLEYAKLKYPSEQRPPVIKSNAEGDVNFTFNLLPVPIPKGKGGEFRDQMSQAIKRFQPSNVFFETKEWEQEENQMEAAWFDYKSHGIDEKLYNLVYFIPIGEKVLHGVFNCSMTKAKLWKPVVEKIIESIAI